MITTILSCSKGECGDPNIGPKVFNFQITDKVNGEDLFSNGTYTPQQIEVINILDDSPVEYIFDDSVTNFSRIYIDLNEWATERVNIKLTISGDDIFTFSANTNVIRNDCFNYTDYKDISITGSDFVEDGNNQNGFYIILVE